MKTYRSQPSKQDLQDLLKKLLHQNGMCLLIYPQGSNTSLLTALAETIHANEENLHEKLTEKLQHDCKHRNLPRRLRYIYNDLTIIQDFRKHPELVQFSKICLQLFSVSTERRLNVFSLVPTADCQYNLSCIVINENGYSDNINIARISNKYYNIKQRNLDSQNELSLEDVFKNPLHIDSDELIETFKEPNTIAEKQENKIQKIQEVKLQEQNLEALNLNKAKSKAVKEDVLQPTSDYDSVSLGDKLQYREDTKLINQCNNGIEGFQGAYHQNNPMIMSQQQLYYLYYQQTYYPGKSQAYLNYPQQPAPHSMSPSKSPQVYKQPTPVSPIQTYYPPQPYSPPIQAMPSPTQISQTKRFTGRLKFFDDGKNYGFIIMDADQSDIFVHYDDLQKAGISKDVIKSFKNEMYMQIRFNFKVMEYFGKYKKSRKAVELVIIDDGLGLLSGYPLPQ